jgi:tRNA threonylcarbamoyl adenosine modification protein YeaZ
VAGEARGIRVHTVLIVVLDCATPAVTAAVAAVTDRVEVLAARVTVDGRAHGELLAPNLDAALRAAGAKPRDLAAVVAGVGPGPFTGLRVGLVTAAALADTLDLPGYAVSTLDAIGWSVPGRVLVATDARRREVYWAVYDGGTRIAGPAVGPPAGLPLPSGVTAAVGEGALRYADALGLPVLDEPRYPPPAGLAALAADRVRAKAPGEPLTPLYLRRPDAVEPTARKAVTP